MPGDVTIDFDGFDKADEKYQAAMRRVLKTIGLETERRAKQRAPVDTGNLRNSIYTWLDGFTNRPETLPSGDLPSARGGTAYRSGEMADPVQGPLEANEVVVAVAAEYGIYVEMGTITSPAQPFLVPSFEEVIDEVPKLVEYELKREGLI